MEKTQLSAVAAAKMIRPMIAATAQPVSAEDRHHRKWIEEVCKELGLETSYGNVLLVQHLLDEQGIEHLAADYPKGVSVRDSRNRLVPKMWPGDDPVHAGQPVIFASKEEDDFYHANGEKGLNQGDLDAWKAAETPQPGEEAAPAAPAAPAM